MISSVTFVYSMKNTKIPANEGANTNIPNCIVKSGPSSNDESHLTHKSKHSELIKSSLEEGKGINLQDEDQEFPLIYAIKIKKSLEIIKSLIDEGADVNSRNKELQTPLHIAAQTHASIEILKLLIDKGADVNSQDKNKKHLFILQQQLLHHLKLSNY